MQISIALATYNGARFLREQLESYTAQTLPPYEVVVCDDGSTDGTPELVEAFAQGAPFPVRLVRNERNLGYSDNFLTAASLCTGEWVAFSDQDDVWLPEKLARVAEAARTPGVRLVAHSAALVTEALDPTGDRFPHFRRERVVEPLHLQPLGFVLGFACTFERGLLAGVPWGRRPSDPNVSGRLLSHDQLIPFLANVLGRTLLLPDVLALYRRHGSAATGEAGTGAWDRSLGGLIRQRLGLRAEDYRRAAAAAGDHVRFLAELEALRPAAEQEALRRGATYYGTLADVLARRAELYDEATPRARKLATCYRLLRRGRYARVGDGRGVGYAALAKDALSAVAT